MLVPASFRRIADAVGPAGGGAGMATGVVSGGLRLDDEPALSDVLLGLGIALWLGLAVIFLARLARQPHRWLEEARSPASRTAAAGTAVLGSRLTLGGAGWAGYGLLAVAVCLWLWLLRPVLANWPTPAVGVSFLLIVATESLAVLAALLADDHGVGWLACAALALLVLGVVAYVFVLAQTDLRQLLVGRGDHWSLSGRRPRSGFRSSWRARSPSSGPATTPDAGRPCSRSACTPFRAPPRAGSPGSTGW